MGKIKVEKLICMQCLGEGEVRTELVSSKLGYLMDRVFQCPDCGYREVLQKEIKIKHE
jgi:uncharacterized Zn finger protein